MLIVVLLGGCVGAPWPSSRAVDGVAVLGVTAADGVAGFNLEGATRELVTLAGEDARRTVVPPARVRAALGRGASGARRLDALLDGYAREGRLDDFARRQLLSAPLGVRHALVVRIDIDTVREHLPRREPIRDAYGRPLDDRERVHLRTSRETVLSFERIDLASGESRRGRFVVRPRIDVVRTRYFGSSFGGSVTAAIANRLVTGSAQPRHPSPPPAGDALRALLDELVGQLPEV